MHGAGVCLPPIRAARQRRRADSFAAQPLTLAGWNDGAAKQIIVDFVNRVTTPNGPDFVTPEDRIATFDNDGTLWLEQPIYTQLLFAFDKARALAKKDKALAQKPAFKALLHSNRVAIAQFSDADLIEIVNTTHSGMTPEVFAAQVKAWLDAAENNRFNRSYRSSSISRWSSFSPTFAPMVSNAIS